MKFTLKRVKKQEVILMVPKKNAVKNFIKKQLNSKEDWWMPSKDAVFYGFADGIFGENGFGSLEEIKKNIP